MRHRVLTKGQAWHADAGLCLDDAILDDKFDDGTETRLATADLGRLDVLPLELLHKILSESSLPDIARFRDVSHRAAAVVDCHLHYHAIHRLCPKILKTAIQVDAHAVTLDNLFAALRGAKCTTCDNFGDYIYLVTAVRVCHYCLTYYKRYSPLTEEMAERRGIHPDLLVGLPSLRPIAGRYGMLRVRSVPPLVRLIDRYAAEEVAYPDRHERNEHLIPRGRSPPDPHRYMVVISAPHIDADMQDIDWACFCTDCKKVRGSCNQWLDKFDHKFDSECTRPSSDAHTRRRVMVVNALNQPERMISD